VADTVTDTVADTVTGAVTGTARRALLLWWATNTRCACVVAAAARAADVPMTLVLDPQVPAPAAEVLAHCHVVERRTAPLCREELEAIAAAARAVHGLDELVLVPTSEYLLDTLHARPAGDLPLGVVLPCTSTVGYRRLSSKSWGADALRDSRVLPAPQTLKGLQAELPFVAKPRQNVVDGRVLRPFLVEDLADHARFEAGGQAWFAQEYVPGPSWYWCAHRAADGRVVDYFQRNLVQRPGGGSIVLAAAEEPPDAVELRAELRALLARASFVGPAMVELRGPEARFIELNPRLWGPLLLDAIAGGVVLDAFLREYVGVGYRSFLTESERAAARLYLVPSALDEPLVAVNGPDHPVRLDAATAAVIQDAAGLDPRRLGGDW